MDIDNSSDSEMKTNIVADSPLKNEAINALSVLGFSPMASSRVLDKILQNAPDATIETLIKTALKML